MMKERMRNERKIFYILKLAKGLCPLAMDLGRKAYISSKKNLKLEWGEEL